MVDIKKNLEEYAVKNPDYASELGLCRGDSYEPMVELLIRAFNDIKEKLITKIDEDNYLLEKSLYEQLISKFDGANPVKSVLMLEEPERLSRDIAKGSQLAREATEDGSVKFSLLTNETFTSYRLKELKQGDGHVTIVLTSEGMTHDVNNHRLTFYLHHRLEEQEEILHHLFFNLQSIYVLDEGRRKSVKGIKLTYADLLPDESPHTLLADYFQCRQRYFFMTIDFSERMTFSENLILDFEIDDLMHVDLNDTIKMNTVLAQNSFKKSLEPLLIKSDCENIKLSACYEQDDCYQILEVVDVKSDDKHNVHSRVYQTVGRWQLDASHLNLPTTFSLKALVCNHDKILDRVKVGERFYLEGGDSVVFRLLTKPGKRQNEAISSNQWQVGMVHSVSKIRREKALKALLGCFVCSDVDHKQVQAITRLMVTTPIKIVEGALRQQFQIKLYLDETQFKSEGQLVLFAYVIHRFYHTALSMDYWVETKVFISNKICIKHFHE